MPIRIPAWPDPARADGALFFRRARKFKTLYAAAGFGHAFAFAMLTMAEAESAFDPNALGDYVDAEGRPLPWSPDPHGIPTSFGAHQRKRARVVEIRDGRRDARGKTIAPGLGVDIAADALTGRNTIENEVRASLWEFHAYPSYGLAAIEAAKTAYGAAYQATISFERAGAVARGAAEKRGALAETWVSLASGVWPTTRGPAPAGWQGLTTGWRISRSPRPHKMIRGPRPLRSFRTSPG